MPRTQDQSPRSMLELQVTRIVFMRVRREIGKAAPAPKPVVAGPHVLGQAMVEYKPADAAPSAPSKSTKLAKTALSSAAVDGGLLFVTSPKSLKYLASQNLHQARVPLRLAVICLFSGFLKLTKPFQIHLYIDLNMLSS